MDGCRRPLARRVTARGPGGILYTPPARVPSARATGRGCAKSAVGVAQLVELQVVALAVAGSNPVPHPNLSRHPIHGAGVAELVDALDLGSSELCSWRFKSSRPHHRSRDAVPSLRNERRSHVKTEVKSVAENEVMLEVEVPQEEVQRRYEQTLRRLAREVSLPGFRKGKVPVPMVDQPAGRRLRAQPDPGGLPARVVRHRAPRHRRGRGLHAGAGPAAAQADEPFSFSAKVQVRPTPTLGEYKGLTVPKRSLEVTDEQVETQLGLVQERFATLKPVDDRPVQADDFVVVDISGELGGQAHRGRRRHRLHAAGRFRPVHPRLRGQPRSASASASTRSSTSCSPPTTRSRSCATSRPSSPST